MRVSFIVSLSGLAGVGLGVAVTEPLMLILINPVDDPGLGGWAAFVGESGDIGVIGDTRPLASTETTEPRGDLLIVGATGLNKGKVQVRRR